VPRRVPDIRRATGRLGWTPQVPLDEGIKRTIAWWEEFGRPDTKRPGRNAAVIQCGDQGAGGQTSYLAHARQSAGFRFPADPAILGNARSIERIRHFL